MAQEQFCIGEDAVAFAGDVYLIMGGDEIGLYDLELPAGSTPSSQFLVAYRAAIFCKFRGALMTGEDSYIGAARIARQVS
jgi:hypothetical protein